MQVKSQDQEIIYTHRTRDGRKARIVARINHPVYPVLVAIQNSEFGHENTKSYTDNLTEFAHDSSTYDLTEYNTWQDVKVDTPILVSFDEGASFVKRHFAKYEDGKVYAWVDGKTSWSAHGEVTEWEFVKLPDSKE